jgi:putative copper export protein
MHWPAALATSIPRHFQIAASTRSVGEHARALDSAGGVALALRLVPSVDVLAQPYGELLLAKPGGFGLLMGLASLNKWRLGPAIRAR